MTHRYLIIGAGMAGMLAAIKLLARGIDNFAIYEKADRVGGTWRENTYPGLTCDVPSHAYTYSFAPNPDWSAIMPPGSEILAYFERLSQQYDLHKYLRCNEEVTRCEWVSDKWHIKTARGTEDSGTFLIAATGVLHHPKTPDIKGMAQFQGALFHSAQWDHDVALNGKRVAIIGTGSTGVQLVCALADRVKKLTHFQRTPQWVLPIENRPFSEDECQAFRSNPELLMQLRTEPELEANIERFSVALTQPDSQAMREIEQLCIDYLETAVEDPELKTLLRPNYKVACKRLIYSGEFYSAVQHPSVEVRVQDVDEIEPTGIRVADDTLLEFDVIVLATGFHAHKFLRPMQVIGIDGLTLEQAWQHGPSAYLSVMTPGFPNMFMLNGPNGPVGNFSLIEIAEAQWGYIEQLLQQVESGACKSIGVSAAAHEAYEVARVAAAKKTVFGTGCSSWYLDDAGVPATWPWTRAQFHERMSTPIMKEFEMRS